MGSIQNIGLMKSAAIFAAASIGLLHTTASAWATDSPASNAPVVPEIVAPEIKVLDVESGSYGAKIVLQVTNPNPLPLGFVEVECVGALTEKKYVFGPGNSFVGTIVEHGKSTNVVDIALQNMGEILSAGDNVTKNMPIPDLTKCQVRNFEVTIKYAVPALEAPKL